MTWQELFAHSWRGDEVEIKISDHLRHPEKLTNTDGVALYDRSAADTIQRMEEAIEALKGYRQALAHRYAALAAMPYKLRLDLIRVKGWYDKRVTYTLRLVRVYEDGHETAERETKYPGIERRAAISAFEEMQKQRPGIECNMDIDKKSWEK